MDEVIEQRLLGALLRIPFQATVARVYAAVAAAGYGDLRPAHFTPFQHLEPEGLHVADLAERAQMTRQSMAYLIDYLETQGYFARIADPADRRAKMVQLTARGRDVTRIARATLQQLEREWGQHIGVAQLGQLHDILEQLVMVIEQPVADGLSVVGPRPSSAGRSDGAPENNVVISPTMLRHMNCVNRAAKIIGRNLADDLILSVQNPIRLSNDGMPQPDLAVFADRGNDAPMPTDADVLLAIEVADSTRDNDRQIKLPLYAAAWIAETWLFDLAAETIERHTAPLAGRYTLIAVVGRGQSLDSTVIAGLTIPANVIPPQR